MSRTFFYSVALAVAAFALRAQTSTMTLQPGSTGMDATISNANPTTNNGTVTTLRASRNTSSQFERSLLQFDLSSLTPGSIILSARLVLTGINHTGTTDNAGVLQMVPAAWSETVATWNNSTLLKSNTMPKVNIPAPSSSNQTYTLEVTNMVQTMVNTPLVNFGWLLHLAAENNSNNKSLEFGSSDNATANRRPRLLITYCSPLQVNAYVSPGSTATSTNAAVLLQVSQGVPPYTYLWSNSAATKDLNNITPGAYRVNVTDAVGKVVEKVIPVLTDCGTMTYTLDYGNTSSFSDALLLRESFNDNTRNANFDATENIMTYNRSTISGISLARSLMAFDLRMLPDNITVNSAILQLTNTEPAMGSPVMVQLCRANQAWTAPTVTQDNQPAYDTTDVVEFSYDASQSRYDLDVTAHLQKMAIDNSSANGWLLKLRNETSATYSRSVGFVGNNAASGVKPKIVVEVLLPSLACNDDSLNWHREDTYDESGSVAGSEKNYMDNLGRATQQLVKNADGDVFTTQTVYDSYGRPAITSMPAYSGSQLLYHPGFMRNQTGQVYSFNDFDLPATTLNNPSDLQTGVNDVLGYYYSDLNMHDPFQATATNPYTRIEYSGDPGGGARRVSKPGNAFKMGNNKENYTFMLMSGNELSHVFGAGLSYKAKESLASNLDCVPLSAAGYIMATKQIVISPDNVEQITYSAGGKMLAGCYSGLSAAESCTYAVKNSLPYGGTRSADIHLPDVNKTSLYLPLPTQTITPTGFSTTTLATTLADMDYKITDLYTDRLLIHGTDYTIIPGTYVSFVSFSPGFLSLYTGRSLLLRISYDYAPSFITAVQAQPPYVLADAEIDYNLCYGRFSKNYYDLGSALLKSVSPKGFACGTPTTITMASSYDYNYKGQPVAMQSPDQGTVSSVYDTEGKLRFTQNSEQYLRNSFSYICYDKHGRPTESGEFKSNSSTANVWFSNPPGTLTPLPYITAIADQADGLPAAGKSHTTITGYSEPTGGNDVPNTYSYYNLYRSFRAGQVNFIKNTNGTTWYNYDKFDRPTATVSQITEADFVAKNSGIDNQIKTAETTFNYFTGLSSTSTYQDHNSGEKLQYNYAYDANYRPATCSLSYAGNSYLLNTNSYNKLGQLKRVVTGNNYQGTDYVYTLNGGLKAINHPGLDTGLDPGADNGNYSGANPALVNKDLFGEILEFYNNDYERNGVNINSSISLPNSKYNGLTYAVRFKTRSGVNGSGSPQAPDYIDYGGAAQAQLINGTNYQQQELRFEYTYDELNRLATSYFGTYNNNSNTFTQRPEYSETGAGGADIGYDRNGNISRLLRQAHKNSGGTLIASDDLTYTNNSSSNQLTGIVDAATGNGFSAAVNFKTPSPSSPSSFYYNAIGQMTASPAEDIDSITYFPHGKVRRVAYSNGNTVDYAYGPGGEKLKSKYYLAAGNKIKYTWYVGPYLYEYDETAITPAFNIAEVNTYGGVIRVNGSSLSGGYLVFKVTDHLGNVRASYKASGTGNGITLLSFNDYYAFGGFVPGRSWTSEDYRYGFQGQEKNTTGTPWTNFELRQYNPDLGRWFAPDPYGQFASPYLAMANNPVSLVDPDGGWVSFPTGRPGEFKGKARMEQDRSVGSGAFSREEIQKRYEDQFNNLTKQFLSREYGNRENIEAYLNAVNTLNSEYMGLNNLSGIVISFKDGGERITASEANLNQNTLGSNNKQVRGAYIAYEISHYQSKIDISMAAIGSDAGKRARLSTADLVLLQGGSQNWSDGTYISDIFTKDVETSIEVDGLEGSFIDESVDVSEFENVIQSGKPIGLEKRLNDIMNSPNGNNAPIEYSGIEIGTYDKKNYNFTVHLDWKGKSLVLATELGNVNGATFTLTKSQTNKYNEVIHVTSQQATYLGKPINMYVNDNSWGTIEKQGGATIIRWHKLPKK